MCPHTPSLSLVLCPLCEVFITMATTGTFAILRHGERLDYIMREAGTPWTPTAERPFDTPLTETGREQGRLAGMRIKELLEEKQLPLPTAAFTSPMLRCAETLSAVLTNFPAVTDMRIEHGLTESCNLDWYRSWSLPSSDSTWGGPRGVKEEPTDPRAFTSATEMLGTPELLNSKETVTTPVSPWTSTQSVSQYTYANPETRAAQFSRLRAAAESLAVSAPGATVVCCSHGGPCTHLFEELTGQDWTVAGECGFTAISLYKWTRGEGGEFVWECLAVNDCGHLGGRTIGGIVE